MPATDAEVHKGLDGVYVDTTAISMVNPETNSLTYRGYPVQELAARCSFEEVAYLLWHGELPTPDQLAAQNQAERAQRALDPQTAAILAGLPTTAHPMDALRTAVSLLGANDPAENDNSPDSLLAKSLRLFATFPTVVALDQRRRHGLGAMPPRDDLGYAANFLYMTFGEVPEPEILSACGGVADPVRRAQLQRVHLHRPRRRLDAVRPLQRGHRRDRRAQGAAARRRQRGRDVHDGRDRHPGQRRAVAGRRPRREAEDHGLRPPRLQERRLPRAHHAQGAGADRRRPRRAEPAGHLRGPGQGACTRPRACTRTSTTRPGPAYHLIGFDTPTFTPIFAAARIPGWTAHIIEQLGANSLIRPLAAYTGVDERHLP